MKPISLYQVDAFTDQLFTGNPAAVCLLPEWLPEELLTAIATENNLPVTTFLVDAHEHYEIRWFTPDYELDLCGHGSLAAAFIVFTIFEPTWQQITFNSVLSGPLVVKRNGEDIMLNFPVKDIEPYLNREIIIQGLGAVPSEFYQHQNERILVVFEHEDEVRNLRPDMRILSKLDHLGVIVTAPAMNYDFVSRTFYMRKKMHEDPVTGVSHCILAPYWSRRLKKSHLKAFQVSARGGKVTCEIRSDRVYIYGRAKLYLQGTIMV